MQVIPLDQIKIEDRQRKEFPPKHINDLKTSILSKGLLHPIVLVQREDTYHLVAGECRTRAISELHTDGQTFIHNGEPVPAGSIPYTLLSNLSPADIAEAELEENLVRANLTWIEQAEARNLIHEMRKLKEGSSISVLSTAREISELTGKSPAAENDILVKSIAVAPHLANPKVRAAKSLKEAHRIIIDDQTAKLRAQLHSLGMVKTDHTLIQGDCREELKKLPAASVDIILSDPPYGMDADKMKKSAHHHYDDSPENGLEIQKLIIQEGFRILKPRGLIFMFTDIDHFVTIREFAKQHAFTAWRTPVIWRKGDEGFAPWGREGFARTYEIAIFLSKGQKGLKGGGADIKDFKRPSRADRAHAAEKPVALLEHLLSIAGDPGDVVLDPTCGSGAIFPAATRARMRAIGIELDPDYHAKAAARLADGEEEQEDGALAPSGPEMGDLLA